MPKSTSSVIQPDAFLVDAAAAESTDMSAGL